MAILLLTLVDYFHALAKHRCVIYTQLALYIDILTNILTIVNIYLLINLLTNIY